VALIPLVPTGLVQAVSTAAPFDGSPAQDYRTGLAGLALPTDVNRIGGFAESEVRQAFDTAQEYLADSGLDPLAVTGGDVSKVRSLIAPGQLDQFDASLTRPTADGQHEATGWLVRFDPADQVRLIGNDVRVQGTLDVVETSDGKLEVTTDHTFVYAVTGPGASDGKASLFTVRRQMTFRFDHQDLQEHHIEVVEADVAAGPLACTAPVEGFRPILAGNSTPGSLTGADPYDHSKSVGAVCAPLSGSPGAPRTGPSGPSANPSSSAGPSGSSTPPSQTTRPATAASAVLPAR
jgi:hypothetical protein